MSRKPSGQQHGAATAQTRAGDADRPFDVRRGALLAVTLALLTLIVLPGVVQMQPAIYFDFDPRSDVGRQPITSLGPMGAAWFHATCMLVAAIALGTHAWLGGRIRWVACALAGIGMLTCTWQMTRHFDNALFGGGWIAAVALALAVVHLGEHESVRRWLVAGLIALLVPFVLDAGWYVLVEHPQTVAHFQNNERELIESRGWEVGSAAHRAYTQRLHADEALGAFGLSNLFGSVAAALTVLATAVAVGLLHRRSRRWAFVAGGAALAGAVTVWLTDSRGAVMALPVGLVLIVLAWGTRRWKPLQWLAPTAAILLVVAAIGVVLVRGAAGPPETAEGERSLLFRAYYWQGAARMMVDQLPGSALVGLGTAGFEAGYLQAKPPQSPEEVKSAHNVFVDYIAMLGVGGLAWSALLLMWLWQGGRAAARALADPQHEAEQPEPLSRHGFALAAAPMAIVFGLEHWLERPMMWLLPLVLWLVAALAFMGVTASLAARMRPVGAWLAAGLFGAAAVLLVHNQIEMSFFQFAPVTLAWAVVALPAAKADSTPASRSRLRWWPGVIVGVVAVWFIIMVAAPLTQHQHHLATAARALQQNQYHAALQSLDTAGRILPTHDDTLKKRVHLRLEAAAALAQHEQRQAATRMLSDASAILDAAEASSQIPGPLMPRLRASIEQTAARVMGAPQRRRRAAEALRAALQRTPYNLTYRLDLADLLWELDERELATEQYRKVQQISEGYYLDPLKQLTEQQQQHIQARLRQSP